MIPTHMRAVVLMGHGGIDQLLYRDDVPVPTPDPGEVLVNVLACGVNNTDINTRTGWYAPSVTTAVTAQLALTGAGDHKGDLGSWNRESLGFPRIQGAAIAGRIVAVGAGVDPDRQGDVVVVDPVVRDMKLPRWARGIHYIGSERDGGFAEFAAVPSINAMSVDAKLSFVELAGLPCAYQTAEEMQLRARIGATETVLVTGASGGVGSANVQLAKLRGARVIAVAGKDKEQRIRRLGADFFIPRGLPDLDRAVAHLVAARGVDVVLDVTGGDEVLQMWRCLRRAGRYVTAGAISGPMACVDMRDLIYKDLEMYGVGNPEPEAMANLIRYVETGSLKPTVDKVFPLPQVRQAQEAFITKSHVGKIIIDTAAA